MPEGRKRKSPETYNLNRNILASIPKSPASGSKTIFWDKKTTGLGAYRTSQDRISFVFQYRSPIDNITRRPTLGRLGQLTLEQARDMAADRAHDVRRGLDPVLEQKRRKEEQRRADEIVLAVYAEGYIQRRAAKGKPVPDRDIAIIRNDVVRLLGNRRLDRITVDDVEKFAAELYARAPSAERTGLVQLKAILSEASKRDVIAKSPADAVPTPKSGERDRRLSDWEMQRYMEASHDVGGPRGDILELLLRLMKRKNEISRLVWEELDVPNGRWMLPAERNKGRKKHGIALPRQAMRIILAQQPDPALRHGPVFTLDGRTAPEMGSQVKNLLDANMHRRVTLANARDGTAHTVTHFTLHDQRTSGASKCREKPLRLSSDIVDEILLHVVGGHVTRVYQRPDLVEEIGEGLQKWNDWLDELMSLPTAWPGGRDLPTLIGGQITDALKSFRAGWPERTDQRVARQKREVDSAAAAAPRGRRARERQRKAQNDPGKAA